MVNKLLCGTLKEVVGGVMYGQGNFDYLALFIFVKEIVY